MPVLVSALQRHIARVMGNTEFSPVLPMQGITDSVSKDVAARILSSLVLIIHSFVDAIGSIQKFCFRFHYNEQGFVFITLGHFSMINGNRKTQ